MANLELLPSDRDPAANPAAPERALPLLMQADGADRDLRNFVQAEGDRLADQLAVHGALLLRGFSVEGSVGFEQVMATAFGDLLTYQDRATPRHAVRGRVYTSTEYPPAHSIFLHNENAFADRWPTRIGFFCATPAEQGGATPLADVRRVFQRIDPDIRDRFAAQQVMYVRNFGQGFGLPWQTVFNTEDRVELEAYCQQAQIQVEWLDGGTRLRTRQVRPAIAQHPQTGDWIWFNHAATLHVSTLRPALREALLAEFAPADLPNNTYYGDGTEIEPEVLAHIRAAYLAEKVTFPWQVGDLLLVDNLLVAHGREPYSGPRTVWVAMARAGRWIDLSGDYPVVSKPSPGDQPAPLTVALARASQAAPAPSLTALETVIAGIWANALRREAVGPEDNFFELGGQSLDAMDIVTEIRDIFEVPLSLRALTVTPTVKALVAALATSSEEAARLENIAQLTLEMLQSDDSAGWRC
jgi:alpha-ketoglutarate-dependent taurine dioxygenase/acyl carrier protein